MATCTQVMFLWGSTITSCNKLWENEEMLTKNLPQEYCNIQS